MEKLFVQVFIVKGDPFVKSEYEPYEVSSEKISVIETVGCLPISHIAKENLEKLIHKTVDTVEFLPFKVITKGSDLSEIDVNAIECAMLITAAGESQEVIQKLTMLDAVNKIVFAATITPNHTIIGGVGSLQRDKIFIALDLEDAVEYLNTLLIKKKLKDSKILMFGGVSTSVVDSETDPKKVADKFGVAIEQVPIVELKERIAKVNLEESKKVGKRAIRLGAGAEKIEVVKMADFEKAAAMSIAMTKMIAETGATAASVDCSAIFAEGVVAPCIPIHDIEMTGIPAACEGDLNCLILKIVADFIAKAPTFMGNLGPMDKNKNTFSLWHHTAPINFFKDGKYSLNTYGYKGVHFVSDVAEVKQVTVLKLAKSLDKAIIIRGEIEGSSNYGHCIAMNIKIADLREFVHKHLLGNHHVVMLGDYSEEMKRMLQSLDVEVEVC
ncbi:hypothetical protein [Candidatus Epulonipiscium viviparus]|uniref:hypothetical protein n=1 Tax=Candidatus Epulonipiscium viviparus TaxID=420336 RepID=UPI0027380784|nr:hypothetical protein [Candidatus Epulopiscium viviparus]